MRAGAVAALLASGLAAAAIAPGNGAFGPAASFAMATGAPA